MTLALLSKAAEETHEAAHLPMPPLAFGIVAFGLLLALLLVTYAFKSVGTRHD